MDSSQIDLICLTVLGPVIATCSPRGPFLASPGIILYMINESRAHLVAAATPPTAEQIAAIDPTTMDVANVAALQRLLAACQQARLVAN